MLHFRTCTPLYLRFKMFEVRRRRNSKPAFSKWSKPIFDAEVTNPLEPNVSGWRTMYLNWKQNLEKMLHDHRGYGATVSVSYERLNTGENEKCEADNLASLNLLHSCALEEPLHLTPETDQWECTTTLTCCALNTFVLAFNIMAFVPVSEAVQSDFNFSQIQVSFLETSLAKNVLFKHHS